MARAKLKTRQFVFGLWITSLAALASASARAAEPGPWWHDVLQTMQARSLLYDDEMLGTLNLGVRVRNRVAVLWGPVPSVEMSLRAEIRLRTMIELMDVRNELYVDATEAVAPRRPLRATPLFLPDKSRLPQLPLPMVPQEKSPQNPAPILGAPLEVLGALDLRR